MLGPRLVKVTVLALLDDPRLFEGLLLDVKLKLVEQLSDFLGNLFRLWGLFAAVGVLEQVFFSD